MARSRTMTTYGVGLDASEAVKELEKLQERVKTLTDKLSKLKDKMNDPSLWGPKDTESSLKREFERMQKDLNGVMSTYEKGVTRIKGIDSTLADATKASYNTLTQLRTTLTNALKYQRLETEEEIKAYAEKAKRLQQVRDEIAKRDIDVKGSTTELKAKEVMKDLEKYSTSEIQDAIKTTEKLAGQQTIGSKAWKEYSDQIKNANAVLDKFKDKAQLQAMSDQFKQLGNLSASALSEQKKYWQEMVNGAAAGSKELAVYERNLSKVTAEEQKRSKEKAGKVMTSLTDYSVNEIKEAIKATEQLRDAQKPGSKAWEDYASQIKDAANYLESFKNSAKLDSMNAQFKDLGKLSADALSEQKKYWESMMNGAEQGSKELDKYRKNLAQVVAEEQKRNAASVKNTMSDPAKYSVNEIKEAIKVTEQLRDAQRPGSAEWKNYSDQIKNANAVLDKFKDKAKIESMTAQFKNLGNLSKSALAEQKKFWQSMVDGAEKGSRELQIYERNLRNVVKEEQNRTETSARSLRDDVLSGNWKGTIGDAKEAVKLLKEYKETLNTTDTAAIRRVDAAISELNNKTKLAEAGFKSTSEALKQLWRQTKNLGYGNWKGSISELEEMRRKLIAIRDTQDKVLSPKDRDKLQKSIANVDKELAILKGDAIDVNYVLANMKDTPLWKLEKAAEQLKKELRDCSENTQDFADKAAQLRRVNAQIDKLNKKFKETENVIIRTAKRLMAYVAVYGGFNFAIGKIKEMAQANLQLSDTFADVQKTTGLAADDMKELSASINSIDTRTSQQELHNLAAVAGQLGLKSQTDILGFVKASNMITVSLNELGAEGTSSLMKIATLTGEASQGTEKALLSIGSAINELTANSAATAGPIVDLMQRMGGVASQAGLTSAQMAAIGATADALGQSMEITGTSMNKFVTTLMSSSDDIAYALNMDAKALRNMLNEGKTMEAMIAVFEKMRSMGGMEQLAGVMGDLGSEGARMTQVLTALASNVEFLRTQVDLSSDAYKKATSIQNEYNIKNENALAIWQRLGNTLREQVVNSKFVGILESISRGIFNVVNAILDGGRATRIFTFLIWGMTAALIAQRIEWVRNMNALKFAKGWQAFTAAIQAATAAIKANIVAMTTATGRMSVWNKMIVSATMTWKRFLVVLRANWLTALIAGAAALVGWFVKLVTYTSELTRATARYNREVQEEKDKVDALFTALRRENNEHNNKAKIIAEINSKYGDYLGYMLSEHDSATKLAAAHKLINAELEKRMALNLQSTLQGNAANAYAEKYQEETLDIERAVKGEGLFNSEQFKGKVQPGEVNALVNRLVNEAVTAAIDTTGDYRKMGEIDMDEFLKNTRKAIGDAFNYEIENKDGSKAKVLLGDELFDKIEGNIKDLLKARIDYMEDTFDAERAADVEMGRITRDSIKASEENLKAIEEEYNKLGEKNIKTLSEEDQQKHYSKMLDNAQDYVAAATKVLREIPESEREINDKTLNDKINYYKDLTKKIAPLAGEDPWGKNLNVDDWKTFGDIIKNIDTASAESLVAAFKKLESDSAKIPSNVKKFYNMFPDMGLEKLNLQNPADVAKTVHDWAEQIKKKLKEKYGRNTSGGFIFESEGSGSGSGDAEKEARKEMNAALAALEEHFLKRKVIVQQTYLDEKISGEEMNRQIADNDEEFRLARIELRKLLAGDANSFNQSLYPELSGKDLQETSRVLQIIGDAVIDGLRKNIQKDEVEIREGAIKIRQAFEEELLKRDLFGKFENNFRETLDKLELLSSKFERELPKNEAVGLTEDAQKKRLNALIELSKKSYQINEQGMVDELMKNKEFASWVEKLDADKKTVLLQQLRDYYDQRINLQKQYTERLGRELNAWYEQSGKQKTYEETKTNIEKRKGANEILSGAGANKDYGDEEKNITDEFVNEYNRLDKLREKAMEHRDALAEGSQEYIATTALIAQYEMKQNELLAQGQKELTQVYMEEWQKRAERWGEWGEMFGDFLGEQVMLEKQANDARARGDEETAKKIEDQQKKNRQELVKNALNKVVDLAAVWAKELALKMMYNSLMQASDTQRTVSEVTNQGKQTTLSILLDALKGQAHEHGKGLPGLVTGAIIFAATMALQAMAKSAIANMFPEAAAETNKASSGRLATGMLTYKDGRYPTLGNDGVVYDAKYEGANMKTGIYRGGAHFGIFSEKKPEAIIDGDTTQRLIMNHPDIWKAIVTLSKTGRLEHGMRTFASGNIDQLAKQVEGMEASPAATGNADMIQMQATLERNSQVMAQLMQVLAGGIKANINMYGEDGMYKNMKKAEKFASVRKYK